MKKTNIKLLTGLAIVTLVTSVTAKYITVESDQDLAKEQYFLHPMTNPSQIIYIDVKKDLKLLQKGKYILSSESLGMEGMMQASQKNMANPPAITFTDKPIAVFGTATNKDNTDDLFAKSITFGYEMKNKVVKGRNVGSIISDGTGDDARKEYHARKLKKQTQIKATSEKGLTAGSREVVSKLRIDGHTVLIDVDDRSYNISYDFSHRRYAGKQKIAQANQEISTRIASVLSRYMDISDAFIFEVSKPHQDKYNRQTGSNLVLIEVDMGGKKVDYQSFLSNDSEYKRLLAEDKLNGTEYVWGKSKSMTYKNDMMMVEFEQGRAKPQMPTQYLAYKIESKSLNKALRKERAAPRIKFKN